MELVYHSVAPKQKDCNNGADNGCNNRRCRFWGQAAPPMLQEFETSRRSLTRFLLGGVIYIIPLS